MIGETDSVSGKSWHGDRGGGEGMMDDNGDEGSTTGVDGIWDGKVDGCSGNQRLYRAVQGCGTC